MTPLWRKTFLTAHIILSVGWMGAVAVFLALSLAERFSQDAVTVRSSFLAMDLMGRMVIVPLSLLALATGLIQALGTEWGLFKHYWVLVKFILTLLATLALLLHQYTAVAAAAQKALAAPPGMLPDVGGLGTQLVVDAGLALAVLIGITVLSVFKPWGPTQYGQRSQPAESLPTGFKVFLATAAALATAFILIHLAGGGLHPH